MEIVWKYHTPLTQPAALAALGEERGISFPADLAELLTAANGAVPSIFRFMVGCSERVLGAVLSFNREDKDRDTVFTAMATVPEAQLLPFGIDPFGNYICYHVDSGAVVFWDHETGESCPAADSLAAFLDALY